MDFLNDYLVIELILIVISFTFLVHYYLTSTYSYWQDRGIPYEKPHLLFGSFKENILGRSSIMDIHTRIYKQFKDERFAGYFIFSKPVLLIRDPVLIERVLIKDFAHFHERGIMSDPDYEPLTMNLFNAQGQQWRNLRYKLTPTFTSGKLKGMFDQICNCGEDLERELQKYAEEDEPIEAKTVLSHFTTDVIASCAFGLQLKADSPEGVTFKNMLRKVFNPSRAQTLRFNFRSLYPNLSKLLRVTTFGKDVSNYFLGISKATIRVREQERIVRNDFVQLLMNLKQQEQSGKVVNISAEVTEDDAVINQLVYSSAEKQQLNETKLFTENCIAAQSFVFLTAGSESTSAAISFILYAVSKRPDIQEQVQMELDQVLAAHNRWTYQAIKDLTYLDQVIQEGMRMFPIASFVNRDCTVPYRLPGTDIVLEKGQRITIPVSALQMDPQHYPNPEVFDPERFQGNNHRPSATYLPFGDGPRICIAMRFAVLEMKICLARIFSCYTISLSDKTQHPLRYVPGSFIPQVIGGIWIKFKKR